MNITGWWTCSGCGAEAELTDGDYSGYEMPCPDCDAGMTEWARWETQERAAA